MFRDVKGYFTILMLQVFFSIWLVASVGYIESGVYNRDLEIVTTFNFSTLRLVIYEFIFFITIWCWARITKINVYNFRIPNIIVNKKVQYFSNIIVFLINILFILNLIVSGNVLTNSNISRFNFYTIYSKIGFIRILFYLVNPLSTVMGLNFIFGRNKKIKVLSVINIIIMLIYARLTGNEFGVLLYIVFYFFLPTIINTLNSIENKRNWVRIFVKKYKKYIGYAICLFGLVILVKINSFNHVNVFSKITESPIGAFLYRALGLQGDTWWATDKLVINGYKDTMQISNEFKAIFDETMKGQVGIQYLMKLILPQTSLNRYMWGGAELMSGYPALNIVMYGYIGSIFITVIEATLFFGLTSYVYKKVIKKQYFRVFLSVALLEQVMKVFGISGIWYLGNFIPIMCIILILVIEYVYITMGKRKLFCKRDRL